MTNYNYSHNESWKRIYNALRGATEADPSPDHTTGAMEGWDIYLSRVAQLFENSGSDDVGLPGFEYGGIYTSSGTATIEYAKETWTKITGSFHGDMASSDNVAPGWSESKITLSRNGTYWIAYQASFTGGESTTYQMLPYVDGVAMQQAESQRTTNATGDVDSLSGLGLIQVAAAPADVELYFYADITGTFSAKSAQISLWNAKTFAS